MALLEAQRDVLEMIVRHRPLTEVLDELCRIVERRATRPARASILLLQPDGQTLVTGSAPSLPESYCREIDGIVIAPNLGTCAAAAARRQSVITRDIETDPGWRVIRHLPLELGLRAAWSMPILSAQGAVLGTFGTYFLEKRSPTAEEVGLVEVLTRTAALAIERYSADQALKRDEARQLVNERALAESRARLELAVSMSGVGFWHCELPFDELVWDARVREHFFVGADVPVTIDDFYLRMHEDDREPTRRAIQESINLRMRYDVVYRTVSPHSGEIKWIRALGAAAFAEDGTPTYFDGVTLDVTAQKRAQEKLEELNALLTEQDRRKDEFLATLAHELRNPLAPVRSGLHILQRGVTDQQLARVREMMERQIGHLGRMVDDLLDVSRIRLGKVALKKQRLDFRTVLNSALEATRALVEAGGHELAVLLAAQPFPLDADHTRLTQVFANLISNSARYTPAGGRIQIRAGAQGETLVVAVSDTGIGIAEEMLTRVFDLFAQVHEPSEHSQGGLGIGLALVRRLVQMHDGSISAQSAGAGAGSTFTVRLPLAAAAAASTSSSSGNSTSAAKPRRILVVDDNADAAETLKLLLELEGHETRCAFTGESALAVAAEFAPDTVLLDIWLPGLSGYEVAQRLRQEARGPQSLLLVALTGWGSEEDRQQARAAGFDRHLVKPVELDKLREALR